MSYDDGYGSDTDMSRTTKETCRGFTCVTPWAILLHLFTGSKPKGRSTRWEKQNRGSDVVRQIECPVFEGSINCQASPSVARPNSENRKEASFNIGIGFGLVYLVAARTNEVNKLVELHQKLEMLLRNLKAEFQIQKPNPLSVEVTSFPNEHHACEHDPQCQYIGSGSNQFRREKSLRMDQIEAELATEFNNLHVQMNTDTFTRHDKHHISEIYVENSAPEDSQSTTFIETDDQTELIYYENYSVPPVELERRLHEVLEERQQQKINELESALERAMHYLEEKQRELSWWKDTARLVAQHVPSISNVLMRRDIEQIVHKGEARILSLTYEKSLE